MSASGNPYDKACAESFFKSLKVEWLENNHFETRLQASMAVNEYLLYYNRRRLHSSLDYMPSVEYELSCLNYTAAS